MEGKTPIEKYLLGEITLSEARKALGKIPLFTEEQLNPVDKKKEIVFPFKDKKSEVLSFRVSFKMRSLIEALAENERRTPQNMMECIIRDYFSRLDNI